MSSGMKYDNIYNLFWVIVWTVMLVGVIVGIFWKPVLYVLAIVSAVVLGMYLREFVKVAKMK